MDKIRTQFKNPSSKYRTAPFWSWNGIMEKEELSRQLRDFKAHGIGGAFAHPRIGMVTEYLSEEFFSAWRDALETCRREDMKLYMYDEDAWPSGFAGGKTARENPETVSPLAKYRIVTAAEPNFGGKVIFAAAHKDGELSTVLTDVPKDEWKNHTDGEVLVVYEYQPFDSSWTGGYPYVDLSKAETTQAFLKNTYDKYAERFGEDFGDMIPAVFSDEANINTDGLETIPYDTHVQDKFRELCGYELLPNIAAVFRNFTGHKFDRPVEKIRYDYYYTLHELWIDNFVRPIADWCEKHNIAWTGHDIEHAWPQAHGGRINPSEQTTYEFRQWPGLDLLLCDHLRDNPTNFDKYLMYEIRSAANQFGSERTLCEAYGAGGYHSTLYDYKRLGDFLMVGGINFICQHLSLYSYLGNRKRDCPQSFDYRQPWWNEYTRMADYFARTSYILSSGKMEQRILLLNASTTGYLVPGEEAHGMVDHALDPTWVKNPDMSDYLTIVNTLTDGQWDFDIGDEFSISRNTKIEGGKFNFGLQSYDVVVVSASMKNLRRDTAKLLLEFAENGGKLITTDSQKLTAAEYIEGEVGTEATAKVREAMTAVEGAYGLAKYLENTLEKRIFAEEPFKTGVQHIRRDLGDGRACYFIVNHSMETLDTTVTLVGDSLSKWDLYTGEVEKLPYVAKGGLVSAPLKLERCGSILLVTGDGSEAGEALPDATEPVLLELLSVKAEEENALSLDTVVVETKGEKFDEAYVLEAADKLYRLNDIHGSPWTCVQVGTETMDKNLNFGEDSAFTATYTFRVKEGFVPEKLTLSVECPELWAVSVNGTTLTPIGHDKLDRGMGLYDVSAIVREGENTVLLSAEKFNVLCEVEAVILRGDFSVAAEGGRFVICPPVKELTLGAWGDFGMPFYSDGVVYTYKATLDSVPTTAKLTLPEFDATIVSVKVNGLDAGFIGEEGGVSLEIGKLLTKGENEIALRVAGSLRNILGPHHGYNDAIPYDWSMYERGHLPTAEEYAFSRYGIYVDPELKVL